jgi:hypothetical protein
MRGARCSEEDGVDVWIVDGTVLRRNFERIVFEISENMKGVLVR